VGKACKDAERTEHGQQRQQSIYAQWAWSGGSHSEQCGE
jgi:hypothetical protein